MRENPQSQRQEAGDCRQQVGHDQHRQFGPVRRSRSERVQRRQRAGGQAQADREHQQRHDVGDLRRHRGARHHERNRIGKGAGDTDRGEPPQLLGEPGVAFGKPVTNATNRDRSRERAAQQPSNAAKVGHCSRNNVDAAVWIVDPIDRDLVDAQPSNAAASLAAICGVPSVLALSAMVILNE